MQCGVAIGLFARQFGAIGHCATLSVGVVRFARLASHRADCNGVGGSRALCNVGGERRAMCTMGGGSGIMQWGTLGRCIVQRVTG